jgi:hypothetical protein
MSNFPLVDSPSKTLSERQLTHNSAENRIISTAISPNGKDIVDVDTKRLHLSEAETVKIHDVALSEELRTHFWDVTWSPDGGQCVCSECQATQTEAREIEDTKLVQGPPRVIKWPFSVDHWRLTSRIARYRGEDECRLF